MTPKFNHQIVRPGNPQHHKPMASLLPTKLTFLAPNPTRSTHFRHPRQTLHLTHAKFNLSELLGGRGLCNGEKGVEQELTKQPKTQPPPPPQPSQSSSSEDEPAGFDKELFGLTGGFPGGEKGLINFVEKNPPPAKSTPAPAPASSAGVGIVKKVKAPELPLLLPGMIVMVKSERNPFHLYCGIVQRITDGKAGVLFEGGNWDRLVTFRLEELERREKVKELCPLIECAITNYEVGLLLEIHNPIILGSHNALLEANYDLWTYVI